MIALLVADDRSPFAETMRRGAPAAGASPIVSETFGKVAHPTPTIKVIHPKRFRILMFSDRRRRRQ
jgi:hypothetical protein